ncbi:actin-associated protein FAM107A [Chanos chanos]|uniref:Actin-associated protein FAM107A n=1 Tax=Chanos chanos TaxID=29144 RepID=A0A6J2VQA0_CHACN|nr:actin-associated protein FAM107A-like [Chanos chanos]
MAKLPGFATSDLGPLEGQEERWEREEEEDLDHAQLLREHADESYEELIRPKKLLIPAKTSRSHRELHRELLITHKRGAGVEEKPELQRVLEQRSRAQALKQEREEEESRRRPTPLEQELLKRHQRLEQFEREQQDARERTEKAPEFIRVKESLKRTAVTLTAEKQV